MYAAPMYSSLLTRSHTLFTRTRNSENLSPTHNTPCFRALNVGLMPFSQ